ncbi:L-fucose kinase [Portunus trituberculatus]|uniref:L-fucose kinase n=1 Tax=Portunus trituberculatus TaxID=210409 RepID=A0A5B7EF24_PORTR|nr:L-fucose kinase [Portunus trituberculatus]
MQRTKLLTLLRNNCPAPARLTPHTDPYNNTKLLSSSISNRYIPTECHRLSTGGLLPDHDLLVVVADPSQPSSPQEGRPGLGVGSGGATINAVLVAIERLSAQHQHTTINSELVHHSRILVVHLGRMLAHCPGGAALLRLDPQLTCVPPHLQITPPTLLQHTLWAATKLVISVIPEKTFREGSASVISGAVYLSPPLTETLLGLHTMPPLDRCTYYGMDSGIPSLQVSLYFDLLLPLCSDVSHEEYVSGQCGATYAQAASYSPLFQQESRSAR